MIQSGNDDDDVGNVLAIQPRGDNDVGNVPTIQPGKDNDFVNVPTIQPNNNDFMEKPTVKPDNDDDNFMVEPTADMMAESTVEDIFDVPTYHKTNSPIR